MREGMDPHIIEEPSAPEASCLKVTADQLTHILSLFQTLNLIQPEGPKRLSLKDLDSLRNIADETIGQHQADPSGKVRDTRLRRQSA